MIIKPNQDEKIIIVVLISIAFGLMVGVWSMKEIVREVEAERDLLILHIEELIEVNNGDYRR